VHEGDEEMFQCCTHCLVDFDKFELFFFTIHHLDKARTKDRVLEDKQQDEATQGDKRRQDKKKAKAKAKAKTRRDLGLLPQAAQFACTILTVALMVSVPESIRLLHTLNRKKDSSDSAKTRQEQKTQALQKQDKT
jgi:hypothetical protein